MWRIIISFITTLTFTDSNVYKPDVGFNPLHQYMARSMPCRIDKDCFYMFMGCGRNQTKTHSEQFETWHQKRGQRNEYSPL